MKLLIIDNEANVRNGLKNLIHMVSPEKHLIEEAGSVATGLQKIKSFLPDIVFLDVEMEDGSGFDLMKQVPNPAFQLIFVTAHNQYAIKAFQFSAIDYLMKPVDPDALEKSIEKALTRIRGKDISSQIEFLLQQIAGKHDHERKIVLKDIDSIHFIRISDILYCMAEGTYTRFYLQNRPLIMVSKNLKEYENILEPLGFIRTHHSFLVNPTKIVRFDKTDGGSLILEENHKIPLSQRKKEWVLSLLEARS